MISCGAFPSFIVLPVVLGATSFNCLAATSPLAQPIPKSLCTIEQAQQTNAKPVILFQHAFDGVQDLAMGLLDDVAGVDPTQDATLASNLDIKRVTFGGSTAAICHYSNMAIARGDDWGWHLAWFKQDMTILNYTRMDGVAWVSSPIKKLSKQAIGASHLNIFTLEQRVWVVWSALMPNAGNDIHHVYVAHSGDEGRSWDDAKLLKQTATPVDNFQLLVKENKPYLSWNGDAEVLPLAETQ